MKKLLSTLLAMLLVVALSANLTAFAEGEPAQPEGFPSKNFTCIVPVAAGSAVDIVSRALTNNLDLGKPIVVENLPGASQSIGTAELLNRAHDGYTFSTVALAGLLTQPIINPDLSYKTEDLRPVCAFANPALPVIAVKADSPIASTEDFLELLKGDGSFTYGVSNVAGISQLSISELKMGLGILDHGTEIVYNGSAEPIAALMSGEIDFMVIDDDLGRTYVDNGEMRVVLSLTSTADRYFPDTEYAGNLVEGFVDMPGFKLVLVPADTPDDVYNWLKFKFEETIAGEAYMSQLEEMGYVPLTPDEFMTEEELTEYIYTIRDTAVEIMTAIGLI